MDLQSPVVAQMATSKAVADTQTISISYYNAALVRVGGRCPPRFSRRKPYLCLSDTAGDGSYESSCALSWQDDIIHPHLR
jgi:hypothetical protein